jgi:riboflavin transporter FmnP
MKKGNKEIALVLGSAALLFILNYFLLLPLNLKFLEQQL